MFGQTNSPLDAALRMFKEPAPTASTLDSIPLRSLTHSLVFEPGSVGTALQLFNQHLAVPGIKFVGDNEEQEAFLKYLADNYDQIRNANLVGCASDLNIRLNQFLQQIGSSRRIDPFDGVGMVTLYELATEWYKAGEPGTLRFTGDSQRYQAFTLKDSEHVSIHQVVGEPGCYVIKIVTRSGHTLYFSELPDSGVAPVTEMDLVTEVQRLHTANQTRFTGGDGSVKIPLIEFRTETPQHTPHWLLGLSAEIPEQYPMCLTTFNQDCAYRINEFGAEAKVVTTMVMSRGAASFGGSYVLDQPFYFWVTDPNNPSLPQGHGFFDLRDTGVLATV